MSNFKTYFIMKHICLERNFIPENQTTIESSLNNHFFKTNLHYLVKKVWPMHIALTMNSMSKK